jgi:hypothetical protein
MQLLHKVFFFNQNVANKNTNSIIPSPNPTAPKSTWHRNKNNLSSFGYLLHGWLDGKADIFQNGLGNGPKKPRTQVSYSFWLTSSKTEVPCNKDGE